MANGTTRFAHKYDSYFCVLPNCFKASTERFNTCFERDSLRVCVVHMG